MSFMNFSTLKKSRYSSKVIPCKKRTIRKSITLFIHLTHGNQLASDIFLPKSLSYVINFILHSLGINEILLLTGCRLAD